MSDSRPIGATPVTAGLVGVVLAAGFGSRLQPLTFDLPKALCPLGDRPLVDHALGRFVDLAQTVEGIVVNAHHHADLLVDHVANLDAVGSIPLDVAVEARRPLGTGGTVAALRDRLGPRPVLVVNADTWTDAPLDRLLEGWDCERPRVLIVGERFGPRAQLAGVLLPSRVVAGLPDPPGGLWAWCLEPHHVAGTLDVVAVDARFADCGTPRAYLRANLEFSGGETVIGAGAEVDGVAVRTVVWPGGVVHRSERLVDAIRTTSGRTVLVR